MKFQPLDYQKYTIDEIIKRKIVWLNLTMGLGKTVCTLQAINYWLNSFQVSKVLIVAPINVCKLTWLEELAKFSNLHHITYGLLLSNLKDRIKVLNTPYDIYIINEDKITWLVNYYLTNKLIWDFDCFILDESSHFKNYASKRFKALQKISKYFNYKVLLTGTPMPNGYEDLWAQCYILDNGERLGKYITHYRDTYFIPTKISRDGTVYARKLKNGAKELIDKKIKDLSITFDLSVIKLPDVMHYIINVELSDNELEHYNKLKKDYLIAFDNNKITASSAGVLTNKLMQVASGAVYDAERNIIRIHNKKTLKLMDLIEYHKNESILVYYNFLHEKESILEAIPYAVVYKDNTTKELWDKSEIKVLIANPKSIGSGINLQVGGHIVVWYSMTYDLELFQQANARVYRNGQKETTIYYYLHSKNTIDYIAYKRLTDKKYEQDEFIKDLLKE